MISKIFKGGFIFFLDVEVVQCVLKASSYQEFQGEVVNLFGARTVEGPMSVVETLDQSVSNGMCHCLIAMAFLEVESGPGESVFHMLHDSG